MQSVDNGLNTVSISAAGDVPGSADINIANFKNVVAY